MEKEISTRQCGSCNACCQGWVQGTINDVRIGPYNPCKHCVSDGCAIYEDRPVDPCVNFQCGWLIEQSPVPEHMKPTRCGAVILLNRTWNDQKINYLMPIGERVPPATLEWMITFSRKLAMPMIYFENILKDGKFVGRKKYGYGPAAFVEAVRKASRLKKFV